MMSQTGNVGGIQNRSPACHDISYSRWVSGGVGLTIVICAVVFAILALVPPNSLMQAIGTIGDPHSWSLWTLSAGACVLGGGLILFAIFSGKASSGQTRSENVQKNSNEPTFVKESFHSKDTFEELFADEGDLLNTIPDYPEPLPSNGDVKKNLMNKPMMKGYVEGGWLEFVVLRVKLIKNEMLERDVAKKLFATLGATHLTDEAKKECVRDELNRLQTRTALFLFLHPRQRWEQWNVKFEDENFPDLMPSFFRYFGGGQVGRTPDPALENEAYIQLEEEGFSRIKQLMNGETVEDHKGYIWRLEEL